MEMKNNHINKHKLDNWNIITEWRTRGNHWVCKNHRRPERQWKVHWYNRWESRYIDGWYPTEEDAFNAAKFLIENAGKVFDTEREFLKYQINLWRYVGQDTVDTTCQERTNIVASPKEAEKALEFIDLISDEKLLHDFDDFHFWLDGGLRIELDEEHTRSVEFSDDSILVEINNGGKSEYIQLDYPEGKMTLDMFPQAILDCLNGEKNE